MVVALLLNCVQFFVAPWTVAFQAPLSMGLARFKIYSFKKLKKNFFLIPLNFIHVFKFDSNDYWFRGESML